jgi:hypothetical protein
LPAARFEGDDKFAVEEVFFFVSRRMTVEVSLRAKKLAENL